MIRKLLLLVVLCAMDTAVYAADGNLWELDITEDPGGVAIYVGLQFKKGDNQNLEQTFITQIDTGSCNLVLPHVVCESCNSDVKFSSLGYNDRQRTYRVRIKNYLGARFETVETYARLRGQNNRDYPLHFEVAVNQTGTQKWSGILGLCPQNEQKHELQVTFYEMMQPDFAERRRRFLESHRHHDRLTLTHQLFTGNNERITGITNAFSIFLSEIEGESKLTFGGIPPKIQNSLNEKQLSLRTFNVKVLDMGDSEYGSNYWSIPLTDVKMGSQSFTSRAAEEVVLDTGCTQHQARKTFIDQMVQNSGLQHCRRYGGGSLICQCSQETFDSIPSLEIVAEDGGSITLDRDQFVQFRASLSMCALMFQELPPSWRKDLIVFGLPFFRQYFTLFDNQETTVGIIPYEQIKI